MIRSGFVGKLCGFCLAVWLSTFSIVVLKAAVYFITLKTSAMQLYPQLPNRCANVAIMTKIGFRFLLKRWEYACEKRPVFPFSAYPPSPRNFFHTLSTAVCMGFQGVFPRVFQPLKLPPGLQVYVGLHGAFYLLQPASYRLPANILPHARLCGECEVAA